MTEQQTITIREHGATRPARHRNCGVVVIFSEVHRGARIYPGRGCRGIGRQPDQPIFIDDPSLSRVHARLELQSDSCWLEDRGSHNGTFLNGRRIAKRRKVRPGDLIRCGKSLLCLVDDVDGFAGWPEAMTRGPLVGGPAMARLVRRLEVVAPLGADLLITGESGTGKEIVARLAHDLSGRSGPLVAVNCAAVPEALFEAELFGVRRGAFTGAAEDRPGLIRQAQGGTLFLDEIGDLPLGLQPKLLRALEQRAVRAVGGGREVTLDIRLVTATHRDLRQCVAQGTFREDLFHRLQGARIEIPPLRDRREEIILLTNHALARMKLQTARGLRPTVGFIERLMLHPFAGNVRELLHVLNEAVVEATVDNSGALLDSHLQALEMPEAEDAQLAQVREILDRNGGNISGCASELGRPRARIYELLRQSGLKVEDFR